MIFRLRSYKKLHKKALGKARKSDAEGESLKLLSESGAIIAEFDVVEIRHDSAKRKTIFLILYEMGLKDRDVLCIMDITQEAIRSTRYRIMQNEKK